MNTSQIILSNYVLTRAPKSRCLCGSGLDLLSPRTRNKRDPSFWLCVSCGRVTQVSLGEIAPPESGRMSKDLPELTDSMMELLAEHVHEAYLTTCKRLGWPIKPSNAVPYDELSEDSKELDRASVKAVLEVWLQPTGGLMPLHKQVEAIKKWQSAGYVHELTCGNDSSHMALNPVIENGRVVLKCTDCDYTQTDIPPAVFHLGPNPLEHMQSVEGRKELADHMVSELKERSQRPTVMQQAVQGMRDAGELTLKDKLSPGEQQLIGTIMSPGDKVLMTERNLRDVKDFAARGGIQEPAPNVALKPVIKLTDYALKELRHALGEEAYALVRDEPVTEVQWMGNRIAVVWAATLKSRILALPQMKDRSAFDQHPSGRPQKILDMDPIMASIDKWYTEVSLVVDSKESKLGGDSSNKV